MTVKLVVAARAAPSSAFFSARPLSAPTVTAAHCLVPSISHVFASNAVASQMDDTWRVALGRAFSLNAVNAANGLLFGRVSLDAIHNIVTEQLAVA